MIFLFFSRYEIPPAERVTVAAPRATTLTQVSKDDHVGCVMYEANILRIVKRKTLKDLQRGLQKKANTNTDNNENQSKRKHYDHRHRHQYHHVHHNYLDHCCPPPNHHYCHHPQHRPDKKPYNYFYFPANRDRPD